MFVLSLRRVATASSRFKAATAWSTAPKACTNRFFSSSSSEQLPPPPKVQPPAEMTSEIALGIQDATSLFINWGLGKQRLKVISESKDPLVTKWQQMMEAFMGTQVHVLAGLGYSPDEKGLAFYNQQLAHFVNSSSPELQEELRIKGRDTWRQVLQTAFNVSFKDEISIVDARNMMHKVSLKMQSPEILESISKRAALIQPSENPQWDMAMKHQVIQEVLVNEVYLGGDPSLTTECGFDAGESGYVEMQCVMAEHQTDPLVAQYIGTAMMKIMEAAGLDMASIQKAAGQQAQQSDNYS